MGNPLFLLNPNQFDSYDSTQIFAHKKIKKENEANDFTIRNPVL